MPAWTTTEAADGVSSSCEEGGLAGTVQALREENLRLREANLRIREEVVRQLSHSQVSQDIREQVLQQLSKAPQELPAVRLAAAAAGLMTPARSTRSLSPVPMGCASPSLRGGRSFTFAHIQGIVTPGAASAPPRSVSHRPPPLGQHSPVNHRSPLPSPCSATSPTPAVTTLPARLQQGQPGPPASPIPGRDLWQPQALHAIGVPIHNQVSRGQPPVQQTRVLRAMSPGAANVCHASRPQTLLGGHR